MKTQSNNSFASMISPVCQIATQTKARFKKHPARGMVAMVSGALLIFSDIAVFASSKPQPTFAPVQETQAAAPKIPNDQLDSLVAPIALYPDPLLSQTLVASTYPLELIQLQQWLDKNKSLKAKALTDAVTKQPWDPSVQAMAALPDVVKRLADDIQWTTDLGNAFLAQQSDVMDAVQRMRKKAQGTGALKSNEQMKVETQVVESKTVIVVEQSNPEVVYVPSYSPTVVYGRSSLSVSTNLLPAIDGSSDCGKRDLIRRRNCYRRGVGRRRLGLELRLGRQRHQRQREQQFQSQHEY